jgi:formate hydrogenlyase transcriptional activator
VDVRVIAATNRDLEDAVRDGRFRSDLFYRLNVLPLTVPSLRERPSDIPQLVMFFLARFSKKFGKTVETVSARTMDCLVSYPWPGNVRELQNVIERAVVLSQASVLELDRDLLPASTPEDDGRRLTHDPPVVWPAIRETEPASPPVGQTPSGLATLKEMERQHILAALRQTDGVIQGPKGAARILNLHPNTLRSRMEKLGIRRPDNEIS